MHRGDRKLPQRARAAAGARTGHLRRPLQQCRARCLCWLHVSLCTPKAARTETGEPGELHGSSETLQMGKTPMGTKRNSTPCGMSSFPLPRQPYPGFFCVTEEIHTTTATASCPTASPPEKYKSHMPSCWREPDCLKPNLTQCAVLQTWTPSHLLRLSHFTHKRARVRAACAVNRQPFRCCCCRRSPEQSYLRSHSHGYLGSRL